MDFAGIQVEMPKINYNYLHKNYDHFLKKATPKEKLNFLESTLLKRKSLINKNSKRYKEIKKKRLQKKKEKMQTRQKPKCPVYNCFQEVNDDEALMKHYDLKHQDLKALGLDLTTEGQGSSTN